MTTYIYMIIHSFEIKMNNFLKGLKKKGNNLLQISWVLVPQKILIFTTKGDKKYNKSYFKALVSQIIKSIRAF